jgi:hypothetical protein
VLLSYPQEELKMLYIIYDVRDGSLVQISEEMVTIQGYPYSIKEIDMQILRAHV